MSYESSHFVTLNCANCGARLDVYDDMERFACGYCGTEILVQRRGGAVTLKAVTEAIKKVQVGTDKTAAELATVRLRDELVYLTQLEHAILSERIVVRRTFNGCGLAIGGVFAALFLVGFTSAIAIWDSSAALLPGVLGASFTVWLFWKAIDVSRRERTEYNENWTRSTGVRAQRLQAVQFEKETAMRKLAENRKVLDT